MLIPASSRLGPPAVRGFSSAGATDRLRIGVLSRLLAVGGPLPVRRALTVRQPPDGASIEAHLTEVLGQRVRVAVWVGARHGSDTFVLQILDAAANTVAFCRVGATPRARELVRSEARALAVLRHVQLHPVVVPLPLYHGVWRGLELLVQTPLRVSAAQPRQRVDTVMLATAMRAVARSANVHMEPLATSGYLQQLQDRLARLRRDDNSAVLHRALGNLVDSSGTMRWRFGSWHGDWTAQKARQVGDRLQIWDWQQYDSPAPMGYDAVHFALHRLLGQTGRRAGAAETVLARAAPVLEGWRIKEGQEPAVVTAYLIDISARYLHDEQTEEAAKTPQVHTWLLPAIAKEAQRLASARRHTALSHG